MEKKQIIEIICVIAGFTLAIKAIDYLQFFITGVFQLLAGQGYGELYYFFIYRFIISKLPYRPIFFWVFVTPKVFMYLFKKTK